MKKITKILIAIIFMSAPFISNAMPSAVSTFPIVQSEVTETTAILRGRAIPSSGPNTKGYFRYSTQSTKPVFCNDTYSSNMVSTGDISLNSGSSLVNFSKQITGLDPGTTYYFCAYASDKSGIFPSPGSAPSPVQSFKTKAPTKAITLNATNITISSATLNGDYNTETPAQTQTWFEYSIFGNTTGTPIETVHQIPLAPGQFGANIANLAPNTNYSFKAVAKSPGESKVYGQSLSFYTKSNEPTNYTPCPPGTSLTIPPTLSNPCPVDPFNPNGGTPPINPNGETPTPYYPPINPNGETPNIIIPTWPLDPTTLPPGTLIQVTTPTGPTTISIDDVVRNTEGIENVFQRQIVGRPDLAKIYGYQNGMDLNLFSLDLAHTFAQLFGYVNNTGKEVRVSYPNIAAYELRPQTDGSTIVNEYLIGTLIDSRKIQPILKTPKSYEYYFQH